MTRILNKKAFPLDQEVTDKDYWIGTDGDSPILKTKNFSARGVKDYILQSIADDGADGDSQLDGIRLADGTYIWVKYSAFPNGYEVVDGQETETVSMSDMPLDVEPLYVGLAYDKDTRVESEIPTDYIWGDIADLQIDANGRATWIKYSDTADMTASAVENGMSDNPLGKAWMGFAFDKDPQLPESDVFTDYEWHKVLGNDGEDGIPVAGTLQFIWFKYSAFSGGRDLDGNVSMVDDPLGMEFIGIAEGKDSWTESDIPEDYKWTSASSGEIYDTDTNTWTWLRYSETVGGTLQIIPTEKSQYIGFALNMSKSWVDDIADGDNLSLLWSTYQWSNMFMDANGGTTIINYNYSSSFTWLKFSPHPDGINPITNQPEMTDTIQPDSAYEGWGVDKALPESEDPRSDDADQYEWFLLGSNIQIGDWFIWRKYSEYFNGYLNGDTSQIPSMHDYAVATDNFVGYSLYHELAQDVDPEALIPTNYFWHLIDSDLKDANLTWTWVKFAALFPDADANCVDPECVNPDTMSNSVEAGDTLKGFSFNHDKPAIADPASADPANYIWGCRICDIQLADGTWLWDKYSLFKFGRIGDLPDVGDISMQEDADQMTYMGLVIKLISETQDRADALAGTGTYSVPGTTALSEIPETYFWGTPPYHNNTPSGLIWIKFANSVTGEMLSDNPENRSFMGIGYFKSTEIESTDMTYVDSEGVEHQHYFWNLIGGHQSYINLAGQERFSWVKWTDNPSSGTLDDIPASHHQFYGLAFDKTRGETIGANGENLESIVYTDYVWHRFNWDNPNEHTWQDNQVRVEEINSEDLTGGVTKQAVADYINNQMDETFIVSQVENVIFDIHGDEEDVIPIPHLDPSIALIMNEVTSNPITTSETLTWNPQTDEWIRRYTLVILDVTPELFSGFTLPLANVLTYDATLIAGHTYEAYVIGYDSDGHSKESNHIDIAVPSGIPDSTPILKLLTGSRTTDGFTLEWNIEGFTALRWRLDQTYPSAISDVYDGADLSDVLSGLVADSEYRYIVTAEDSVSGGNPSNPSAELTVFTLPVVPVALATPSLKTQEALATTSSISFSTLIGDSTEYDYIDYYNVSYQKVGEPGTIKYVRVAKDSKISSISSLEEGVTYELYIQAISNDLAVYLNSAWSGTTIYLTTLRTIINEGVEITLYDNSVDSDSTGSMYLYGGDAGSIVDVLVTIKAFEESSEQQVVGAELVWDTLVPKSIIHSMAYLVTLDGNGEFSTDFEIGGQAGWRVEVTVTILATDGESGVNWDGSYIDKRFYYPIGNIEL